MRHFTQTILVILGCLLAAALIVLPAQGQTNDLSEFIHAEMARSGAPGLAYAVTSEGSIVESRVFGVKRLRNSAPITQETVFIIGSVSKSFTALAIMQLVEAGKIELDASVSQYLIDFTNRPIGNISVRQLLSHTSGLSIVQGNQSQNDYSMHKDALAKRVSKFREVSPASEAGKGWEYSNANYMILGRLLEVISGQSYANYIEGHILRPAGMQDSFVHNAAQNANLATGHRPWFGARLALDSNKTGRGSAPQGGIVSSARDMARYLAVMMNQRDDILSAKGKAMMMRPASEASPKYGFGWFINVDQGLVYHSGSNPGYEALASMIPADMKGAVVLVNAGSGLAFGQTKQLRSGVNARALGYSYSGERTPWLMRGIFFVLILAPIVFLFAMFRAWRKLPTTSRQASSLSKVYAWLPLLVTFAFAYTLLVIVPATFGATLGAASVFQPDTGLLLVVTAASGFAWGLVWRLRR